MELVFDDFKLNWGHFDDLIQTQQQENKALSRERVLCENAFAGVKRYRAVTDVYRNRVTDFDDRLMLMAAGLWNFYLDAA